MYKAEFVLLSNPPKQSTNIRILTSKINSNINLHLSPMPCKNDTMKMLNLMGICQLKGSI